MNKDKIIHSALSAETNDTYEFPAIPTGATWVIKNFGACDINLGDGKSSVYVLMYDADIIKMLSLTGNTYETTINKEFLGDGNKKIKIKRYNKSVFNKEMPAWIKAYKKN